MTARRWGKAVVAFALMSLLVMLGSCGEDPDEALNGDDTATEQAEEFHGYACTVDCSGHEAGYNWAEEHDITDPDQCGGNSQSFIEGCRAYAEEHE